MSKLAGIYNIFRNRLRECYLNRREYLCDRKKYISNPKGLRQNFINFPAAKEDDWIKNFPLNYFCPVENKDIKVSVYKPHIEYFSCFGSRESVRKSKAEKKIFWTGEDVVNNFNTFSDYLLPYVDLAIGFSPENDIPEEVRKKYIRYPLWLLYYFVFNKNEIISKDSIKSVIDSLNNIRNLPVNFCALVASHDRSGIRKKIMDKLSLINEVKSAGKIYHNDDNLKTKYRDDKISYLSNFMFNICPENTNVDGYVTEKLFQSFAAGCIPVYQGGGKFLEPGIINKDAILFYNDEDDGFVEEVKELWTNKKAYQEFISRPRLLDTAVDGIYEMMSALQEKYEELFSSIKLR